MRKNGQPTRRTTPANRLAAALAVLVALMVLSGCEQFALYRAKVDSRYYVKPAVAVMDFQSTATQTNPIQQNQNLQNLTQQNQALQNQNQQNISNQINSFQPNWNVGSGLADVLTDELIKTDRFQVLERAELGQVLGELKVQDSKLTRPEGKAAAGRLKNVEYFVKGKVTDFGQVSSNQGWAMVDWANVFGQRYHAVLRMTFQVIEVESGRIVLSRAIERTARADQGSGGATYKNVTFGGSTFYQTPLGRVTADATREAVLEIVQAVASQPWRPRIALTQGEQVIINGGEDRGVHTGDLYKVVEHGKTITDPDTGDNLARLPGQQLGKVEITAVHERYSEAKSLTQSTYQVGQLLEPLGK
jgi:curli biogenesis system outer membrane secretion channel CsgG